MELAYSIEELEKIYEEANSYYLTYKNSLESLNRIINNMQTIWISGKTGSYEQFKNLYEEKKVKLIEASILMSKICKRLEEKILNFKELTQNTINYFE